MELDVDGILTVEHFVEFDDGDTDWFVLEEEEKECRLRWKKRAAAALVSPPPKKKQKSTESDSEEEELLSDSSDGEEEAAVPNPLPKGIPAVIRFITLSVRRTIVASVPKLARRFMTLQRRILNIKESSFGSKLTSGTLQSRSRCLL